MKPIIYILIFCFSLGACIPNSDFGQLRKLPDMLKHYQLHLNEAAAEGDTLSFFDFLYVHYIVDIEHEHDEESHDSFPLKSVSASTFFALADIHIQIPNISFNTPHVSSNFNFTAVYYFEITNSIFRPPVSASSMTS